MFNLASKARPYLGAVILTTALLTAGGIYSAMRMPSSVYPEVTFPRIAVVAKVPDRDVTNMEVKVTRPLEEAVSSVIGVSQVRAKTIRGGAELSVDFSPGTDMRRAEQQIWARIGAVRSQLPPNADLTVEQMTPSVFPILSLVLTGGDSPAQRRDYAFYELAPLIKNIPDVLYANVSGGDVREIEVICRPDDLLAHGLSAADLADQIGQLTPLQPVGRVENQPLAFQIIVNNQAEKARQIADLVITTRKDQPVRVRDVADVQVLYQDRAMSIGYGGDDAVVITVFRRLGGNTVQISRNLAKLLETKGLTLSAGDPKKKPPRNIQATIVYDQAVFVQTAVDNVRDAILIGGLFSILILLAFLRSWRATLISALAIPTTLAITFLFLHWTGETLNLMSLGGLAVAIGLIIDDTVVVVENIARHLARKSPSGTPEVDPVDAASSEITGAVIGSTLTTVLVFVPLAFIVGVYGQFFAALSWSLCIAVLVSMVISLTVVPVFAAKFLAGRPMPEPGPIYRFFSWMYEKALGVALRFPWTTLSISMAAVGVGVVLFTGIPNPMAKQSVRVTAVEDRHPAARAGLKAGDRLLAVGGKPVSNPQELQTIAAAQSPGDQVELSVLREGQKIQVKVDASALASLPVRAEPAAPLLKGLETGLMPSMDEGAFVVDYLAPAGSPLAETERKAKEIEKVLSKNPDVKAYVRRTGAELGLFATQTSRGDIQVVLRPADEDPISLLTKPVRPKLDELEKQLKAQGKTLEGEKENIRARYRRRPLKAVMEEIEDEIKDTFAEHQLKIELVQIMEDELNDLSGANKPVEVKLYGPDQRKLRSLAEEVGELMEKKGKGRGIKEVDTHVRAGNPDLMIQLDGMYSDKLAMKPDMVARQLKAIFQGQIATQVQESSLRITDVRVRYPDSVRFGTDLSGARKGFFDRQRVLDQWILLPETKLPAPPTSTSTPITTLSGPARAVPLFAMGNIKAIRTPDEQWRENQQPAIFVTAEMKEDEAGLGSVVADIREWMAKDISLPAGYRWELGGHYVRQQEAFQSLLVVMVVAIVLVFIMLAFQFQSVVLPLLIFLTQPLSLVSGLFALWLTHTPLNVSSYMGAILLIGLDMKNGILLVEYIQQLRKEGMPLRPALIEAGRTRFRPILMTSLAAILGLFPLALGIGPGAQMQQPLAIMVIGGLTANMLFTRMVIPVGYLVLEGGNGENASAAASSTPIPATPRESGIVRG
jgi:multidrug efflux pump subunit AcrB